MKFWDNLRAGRNCIGKIPPERWRKAADFELEAESFDSRWGGFINDIDKFDPSLLSHFTSRSGTYGPSGAPSFWRQFGPP